MKSISRSMPSESVNRKRLQQPQDALNLFVTERRLGSHRRR